MSLLRRSARNFVSQTLSFAISILDRIVLTGVFVRAWKVNGFSDWTTLWSTASLLVMIELGFQIYLGNMLVKAERRGHRRAFQLLFELGLGFYLGLSAIVLAVVAGSVALFDIGHALRLHATGLDVVLVVLCCYQMLRIVRGGFTQVLRGRGEYHLVILTDVRATGAGIVGAIVTTLLGGGPLAVASVYLIAELLFGTIWSLSLVRRRHTDIRLRLRKPRRRQVLAAAGELRWYSAVQVNTYLLAGLPILIAAWLGFAGAGLAGLAVQRTLVNFSRTVAATFSAAVGVELATIDPRRDSERLVKSVFAIARLNVALAALAAAGITIFGETVIALWTGTPDLGSRSTLALLLLPVIIVAPVAPMTMLSIYAGAPRAQGIGTGIQLILGLPLAVALGRVLGIDGLVLGLAIGEIVGVGLVITMLVASKFRVPIGRLALDSLMILFVCIFWASLVGLTLKLLIVSPSPVVAVLKLAVWSVVAGVPVLLYALPPRQRSLVLAMPARLLYRRA
ncbi:MAG: hypothetical protein J0I47_01515 [Sphingomonas sp.]|uniref:lipopolysaccharide biosynthesis protein n=1 Tax=Sphingomonas sp. TaxID=28214 RepID=UPI001AD2D793|nr:hypothetical protein [Sphingomonas sp.]MBN8806907.1 hypothetical protein [Sphingomonas sp.]